MARPAERRARGADAEVDAGGRHLQRRQGAWARGDSVGLNPKNLALTVAAATAIAQTSISTSQEAGALAIFILIGSLTILAPLVIYFAMGTKATKILDGLRLHGGTQQRDHDRALLVLGAKLIGDAISGFSS